MSTIGALCAARVFIERELSMRGNPPDQGRSVLAQIDAALAEFDASLMDPADTRSDQTPQPEPIAWMTGESRRRLMKDGGNSRGAVPVHARESSTAKIPLYLQTSNHYAVMLTTAMQALELIRRRPAEESAFIAVVNLEELKKDLAYVRR